MPDPRPQRGMQAFFDWLAAGGARFPGASPQPIPGMGMGLVAQESLEIEDPILFVPRDLWLTRKSGQAAARPVVDDAEVSKLFSHSMSRLALLVACEQAVSRSFFRPYLDALGEPTVPYELTLAERRALGNLPLGRWIDEQHAQTVQECAALQEVLRARFPENAAALDLARWQWAYGHVVQRTFSVDQEDDEVWVLVPGMDLVNHADEPNARYFAEEDGWHLEACRPIPPGEQISIRYGRAKTSSDLLLDYGFVTPRNPNDRVHLKLALPEADPDRAEKRAAIEVLGLRTDCLVGPDGIIPSAFLHAAILWGLDSATFRDTQPDISSPQRAMDALDSIATTLEHMQAGIPSGGDEDTAGWLPAFAAYRRNVIQLQEDAARAVRQRIAVISVDGWAPQDVVEDDPDGRYGMLTIEVRA